MDIVMWGLPNLRTISFDMNLSNGFVKYIGNYSYLSKTLAYNMVQLACVEKKLSLSVIIIRITYSTNLVHNT